MDASGAGCSTGMSDFNGKEVRFRGVFWMKRLLLMRDAFRFDAGVADDAI